MQANPTVLRMKYARIVEIFAEKSGLSLEEALDKFYNSMTYVLMSEGISDMHCMSDGYLADELLIEYGYMKKPGYDRIVADADNYEYKKN